jgi:hypothetical protein
MFRSAENLRLAADMRALQRVAAPWREARSTWFDGTPESLEARLAATERVLTYARGGMTPAHVELEREASIARAELKEASHRLLVDFLDDSARAFKGSKRVALDYDEAMSHIDQVLAEGEGHELHNYPGAGVKPSPVGELASSPLNPDECVLYHPHDGEECQDLADIHWHNDGKHHDYSHHEGSKRVAGEYPLGPGYDRPGFGPDDLAEYEDHLHEHGYHTDSEDLNALVHKLRPNLDDDDPARYSSKQVAAGRYFNDAGEPLMSGEQARFEDALDQDSAADRAYDDHYDDYGPDYDDYDDDDDEGTINGQHPNEYRENKEWMDFRASHNGSRRSAKERGLRECINCGGALSGEEDDDKDSECATCGMSAHEKNGGH